MFCFFFHSLKILQKYTEQYCDMKNIHTWNYIRFTVARHVSIIIFTQRRLQFLFITKIKIKISVLLPFFKLCMVLHSYIWVHWQCKELRNKYIDISWNIPTQQIVPTVTTNTQVLLIFMKAYRWMECTFQHCSQL